MRAAQRDHLVSAAQVALQYGGYTLETAMALSRDERELLIAVAVAREETLLQRVETSLGTRMELATLLGIDEKPGGPAAPLPAVLNIPLLAALAPEMMDHLRKRLTKRAQSTAEMLAEVPDGGQLVEVGNLSIRDAKAFFRKMASQLQRE